MLVAFWDEKYKPLYKEVDNVSSLGYNFLVILRKEDRKMIFEKMAGIIAEHVGCEVAEITESTTFEDLGVDSLDTVEMVMKLEEELDVELELEGKFETVGELSKFIESKIG